MVALARSAWVLNFDAEDELQSHGYTRSAKTNARLPSLLIALRDLMSPGDIVVSDSSDAKGYIGRAWCPTPQALVRLARAGAIVQPAPDVATLRAVNHRRFCADLGQCLPGAEYVVTKEALWRVIARETRSGHWLLKRPFGFAGRGRRRVAWGALEKSAETWVDASLRHGEGLQVEPWVERRGDYAIHGHIAATGDFVLGEPTQQSCDATGAWQGTSRETDLDFDARDELLASATLVASKLAIAGYFGPFGVDAYRYDDSNRIALNPRSEINARYSMGWAIGMGSQRPDREIFSEASTPSSTL